MQRQDYKPRVIDQQVKEYLTLFGAIVVEGPKWCGKTWTSSQHSKSEYLLGDPSGNFQNRQLAAISPELVLAGESPRMLDEWQEVPMLWDAVRATEPYNRRSTRDCATRRTAAAAAERRTTAR